MSELEIEPVRTEFVFEAKVDCDAPRVIGPSKHGRHQLIPIVGGSFAGPRIRGDVLAGGADWQHVRADGVVEIEARYTIRAEDGALISVCNRGIANMNPTPFGSPGETPGPYARTQPEFEAPVDGPHDWLNKWLFVGTLQVLSFAPLTVQVRVFRVL